MQKPERLLDLAAFLLRAAEPVSWREIQEQFPGDYAGSEEASIRKFERDKAELLDLGIPVRWVAGDEDLSAGYLIERDEFYLPNLELAPEDLALLYLAGSAALAQGTFPYAKDLAHALNKLSFAARAPGASETAALAAGRLSRGEEGEMARPADGAAVAGKLEILSQALAAKKRVHVAYVGAERRERTERDVDPYGLYQSGGAWFLVGHCHLRKALRTFHLNRIVELAVNPATPRTPDFEVPKDFDVRDHATRPAWEYAVEEPVRCTVRIEGPVSPDVRTSFGARAEVREEDGALLVQVTATHTEALVGHVLSLGDRAHIVAPKRVRDRARAVLAELLRRSAA